MPSLDFPTEQIRRDQRAAMPGRCVIQRPVSGSGGLGGAGTASTMSIIGTVSCRVRPLFGQATEAEIANRWTDRENWLISMPHDSPLVRTQDVIVYLEPNLTTPTQVFTVHNDDDSKGEWDTVRRIVAMRTGAGGAV